METESKGKDGTEEEDEEKFKLTLKLESSRDNPEVCSQIQLSQVNSSFLFLVWFVFTTNMDVEAGTFDSFFLLKT